MQVDRTPARHDGDLGTVLGVFAHPDDEAYLAGALMAQAADAGRRVVCVTATRGELGFPDDDPRSLAERQAIREAELASCLDVLGVREHHWLDYPDGGCAAVDDGQAVDRLLSIVETVRPDTILTFGPDGQTLHEDHMAVSRWSTLAVEAMSAPPRLLYAVLTDQWLAEVRDVVDLDQLMMVPGAEPLTVPADELSCWFVAEGELLDRKVRALRCQASQVEGFVQQVGLDRFAAMVADETFCDPHALPPTALPRSGC